MTAKGLASIEGNGQSTQVFGLEPNHLCHPGQGEGCEKEESTVPGIHGFALDVEAGLVSILVKKDLRRDAADGEGPLEPVHLF